MNIITVLKDITLQIEHIGEDHLKVIALGIQALSVFAVASLSVFAPIFAKRQEMKLSVNQDRNQRVILFLENNRTRRKILEEAVLQSENLLYGALTSVAVISDIKEQIRIMHDANEKAFEILKTAHLEANKIRGELENY